MSSPLVAGIVLAAGKGTRMKSELPKVLHPVCGVPMVQLVCRAMRKAGIARIVVVIGHGAEQVRESLGAGFEFALQDPPLGTGDAARKAIDVLGDFDGTIVVASGDTPLMTDAAIKRLIERRDERGAAAAVATIELADPTGYGRIIRAEDAVKGIVEQKDATPEQRAIREINASVYAFDAAKLQAALPRLTTNNAQGEYYLTDVVGILSGDGESVVAELYEDAGLFDGVNDRWQLAQAEKVLRNRINRHHALSGVTLIDPDTTYIGPDVEIGRDTVIYPSTYLEGETKIGAGCEIGPNSRVRNSVVGDDCRIYFSHLGESQVANGVKIGPYAHLRGGAKLGDDVKIGNFVELKNAELGEGVSVAHLSYLGDAQVGERTNIGAGTITCNYDGFRKNRTTIGANAFVGSNSTLIAPVTIGDGGFVAAGSVINKSVPADAAAFGRARQETKEEWATHWRNRMKASLAKETPRTDS